MEYSFWEHIMQKSLHALWDILPHNPTIVKLSVGLGLIAGASWILVVGIFFFWGTKLGFRVFFGETFPSRTGILYYIQVYFRQIFFFGWYLRTFLIFYCGILETQTQHLNMFNCIVKLPKRKHFSMNILGGQSNGHGLLLCVSC